MNKSLFLVALSFIIAGCASTTDGVRDSQGSRNIHVVEQRKTFVVMPPTETTPAQIVPVTETTESWHDEQTKASDQSRLDSSSGPDLKQIAPIVGAVSSAVIAGGTGGGSWLAQGGLAALTALSTAAIGYGVQKRNEAKFHKDDATEGYRLANENALKVTPQVEKA